LAFRIPGKESTGTLENGPTNERGQIRPKTPTSLSREVNWECHFRDHSSRSFFSLVFWTVWVEGSFL